MELIHNISTLRARLEASDKAGNVGFVPTMGALHEGHLSLVRRASEENATVVVSIFVNPTQFNDKGDLERYPRNLERDLEMLAPAGCDIVFAPLVEEIYPQPDTRIFDFGGLDEVMEGRFRPGHFNGVAQVVSRLFDIVRPGKAYFGLKDFQQLAIIRYMTELLKMDVEIVACDIVREASGLAMSSRNELLTPAGRVQAAEIFRILSYAGNLKGDFSVSELARWISAEINKNPYLRVEYVSIVDENSLQEAESWGSPGRKVACVAVWCGNIRLIDNMVFNN
jgi:pantoate--beta-alanine ligase